MAVDSLTASDEERSLGVIDKTAVERKRAARRTLAAPGKLVPQDCYRIPADVDFSVAPEIRMPDNTMEAEVSPEQAVVVRDELEFLPAPGLKRIIAAFIELDPRFTHLQAVRILPLWARGTLGKKHPLGKTQIPSGLLAYAYRGWDFVIQFSAEGCREAPFTAREIEGLVFHELKHCGVRENEVTENGRPIPMVIPHDFEGFGDEIIRYGAWHPGARVLEASFRQLSLDDASEVPDRRRDEVLPLAFPSEGG